MYHGGSWRAGPGDHCAQFSKEHIFRCVMLHQHLRSTPYFILPGRTSTPRPVANSRGRRRQAGTKTLAQVLCREEENFIDFIAKCLHWDSERRLKPRNVLPHPFVTAGRRRPLPVALITARCPLASSSSSRVKASMLETSKTQIGAPTPLTACASGNHLAPCGLSHYLPTKNVVCAQPATSTKLSAVEHSSNRSPLNNTQPTKQ